MKDFNYVKYTKNNPLLKEAFGGDALSNYLKAASQRCFDGGGNGQNLLDNASELASFLDAYDISYARGGAEEPGFYTPGTAVAFKKLIDSMVDDEIENNNMSKYGAGNDDDNYDEFTDSINNLK
jgi:hypothetical protein